ncbi:hypothetical protein [Ornithinimicrobium kibberense]
MSNIKDRGLSIRSGGRRSETSWVPGCGGTKQQSGSRVHRSP